jgi:hypothetical protein
VRGAAVEAARAAGTGAAGLASTAASTLVKSSSPEQANPFDAVAELVLVSRIRVNGFAGQVEVDAPAARKGGPGFAWRRCTRRTREGVDQASPGRGCTRRTREWGGPASPEFRERLQRAIDRPKGVHELARRAVTFARPKGGSPSAPKARSPIRAEGAFTHPRRRRVHVRPPEGRFTHPRRRRVHLHPSPSRRRRDVHADVHLGRPMLPGSGT